MFLFSSLRIHLNSPVWIRPAQLNRVEVQAVTTEHYVKYSNSLFLGSLTVKRLDQRLDCLRTGVGVLAVGGTSIRSSFWLVLGVDGTEEE